MPIVAINAATPGVFGFNKEFRNKMGTHYVDVGIAEEHAVAMTSGLAKVAQNLCSVCPVRLCNALMTNFRRIWH